MWVQKQPDGERGRGRDEENVPAEEEEGKEEARVSEAELERRWAEDPRAAACEGQKAPDEQVGGRVSSQGLGRDRRIGSRRALELTVRSGLVVRCPYFKLRYRRGVGPPGVGFLAGRRVGGAVTRNRAKRVLREAFRTSDVDLSGIETLVFIATERTGAVPFAEIRRAVDTALREASDQAG